MKTYIISGFDLTFKFCGEEYCLRRDEIICTEIQLNGFGYVCPKDTNIFLPYEICFDNLDKKSKNIVVIKQGISAIFIFLCPICIYPTFSMLKRIIKYCNDYMYVEYSTSNCGIVQIFYKDLVYRKMFFQKIKCFEHSIININECEIVCFKFLVDKREYCIYIKEDKILFDGYIKDINVLQDKLVVLSDDINCFGQKRVFEFNCADDKVNKYLIVYDQRKVFYDVNVIYYFIDALNLQNRQLLSFCLTNDLNEIKIDCIMEFFEEFDHFIVIEDNCILIKNNEMTKVVHFVVDNNKITNIYC